MQQSTRLIVNAAVTVGRMALTIWIGLLTIRWVYQMLGEEDYGVLTAAGSLLAIVPILTEAIANSSQRHLAWEIGRDEREELQSVFSTLFFVCLGLAIPLWLLLAGIGPLVIRALSIPPGRETAALVVYLLSATTICGVLALTPYRAYVGARQWFVAVAVLDVIMKLVALAYVYLVRSLAVDHLVFYALGLSTVMLAGSAYWVLAVRRADGGLRPRRSLYRPDTRRELLAFAGWASLMSVSFQLRVQAPVLLLNLTYGLAVNAAYAMAAQVMMYAAQVPILLTNVASPAVVGYWSRDDRTTARTLALIVAKLSTLVLLCLTIPLVVESSSLLSIWLGDVPPYAAALTVICGFIFLGQTLSSGHLLLMSGLGDLRGVMLRFVAGDLAGLTVGAILVVGGWGGPLAVPACLLVGTLFTNTIVIPAYCRDRLELPIGRWLGQVVLRLVPAAAFCGLLQGVMMNLPEGPARLLANYAACGVGAVVVTAVVGLTAEERRHARRLWHRLRVRFAGRPVVGGSQSAISAGPTDPP